MKRLLACVSLAALTTTAAIADPASTVTGAHPTPAPRKAPVNVAPADEYFGKLKMSILGIRNTIKDVGANIDIDQTRWTQLASKANFAEDAMRDWERKYPRDTWLAKTVFSLERMYAKLDTDDGRKHSVATMHWLIHDFPATWYGKAGKRELAQGKVGRSLATVAAPSPSPSIDQIAAPGALSSPSPAGEPAASPSPVSTPFVAAPTPAPAATTTTTRTTISAPYPSPTPPLLNPP